MYPYVLALSFVKKQLQFSTKFRKRAPRSDDLARLTAVHRELVQYHLSGESVRQHPKVLSSASPAKYFSAARKRILEKLRVDIGIPWSVQSERISQNLDKLLAVKGNFKPPLHVQQHVFGPKTVPLIIAELDRRIVDLLAIPMQQRIHIAQGSTTVPASGIWDSGDTDQDLDSDSDINDLIG